VSIYASIQNQLETRLARIEHSRTFGQACLNTAFKRALAKFPQVSPTDLWQRAWQVHQMIDGKAVTAISGSSHYTQTRHTLSASAVLEHLWFLASLVAALNA
jgi:hypothetical protein